MKRVAAHSVCFYLFLVDTRQCEMHAHTVKSTLRRDSVALAIALAVIVTAVMPGFAAGADINVLASGATKEAYVELVPAFEKASGHHVVTTWTGSANIKKQIAAGEVYDLVIVADEDIDRFIQQGKLVPGSRMDLMKSGVGVAVRAGTPRPDISSSAALKETVLTARSIGYSTGPSGNYVISMFERMGIGDQIKAKLKQVPSGGRISTLIASGEAQIGFQQISELIHAPGVDYVGPLPSDVQSITVFSSGIHSAAEQPEAAREFVKFLTAPAAAAVIKKHGMEPA
jgi:molybdate transport system substrate-binding protein